MFERQQNSNPWFATTIGLVGLIVGYGIATAMHGGYLQQGLQGAPSGNNGGQVAAASSSAAPSYPPAAPGEGASIGKSDAPITLIEFTDFQCPYCQRHFLQTFGDIKKNYVDTGKVRYVIRHFPLVSIHPNAQKSAESASCANDQGKFWEMHEKLFSAQKDWSDLDAATAATTFKKYAADLGLNADAFNKCLDGGEKAALVQKDTTDGSASGINGTPGFWILGPGGKTQMISGAYPYASFQTAFDGMAK